MPPLRLAVMIRERVDGASPRMGAPLLEPQGCQIYKRPTRYTKFNKAPHRLRKCIVIGMQKDCRKECAGRRNNYRTGGAVRDCKIPMRRQRSSHDRRDVSQDATSFSASIIAVSEMP